MFIYNLVGIEWLKDNVKALNCDGSALFFKKSVIILFFHFFLLSLQLISYEMENINITKTL